MQAKAGSNGEESRAVQAKAGSNGEGRKREKPERKQRLFWLGTAKSVASSRAVEGEGRQERKAGAKAEAFLAGNGEGCTVEQSRVGQRPPIFMMCCDRILFPIFRSSFFCHMEAMKVYISGQSAVGTEDPAFIAEGIHDLMNGGDDFLIGSVHQHTVTVIETA